MTEQESLDAMRPETKSPLDIRELSYLERFGLGRVTASFTWCCQLTVVTKKCINIMYILGLGILLLQKTIGTWSFQMNLPLFLGSGDFLKSEH